VGSFSLTTCVQTSIAEHVKFANIDMVHFKVPHIRSYIFAIL
jgi:hypothetical protein